MAFWRRSQSNNPFEAANAGQANPQRISNFGWRGQDINRAQGEFPAVLDRFNGAHSAVENAGAAVTAQQTEELATAARQLNNSADRVRFAKGEFGASVKGMFRSFAQTVGIDTSQWGRSVVRGANAEAITENAQRLANSATSARVSAFERLLSKPFRLAANNPVLAMFTGAAAAAIGVGAWASKRSEKRTQRELMDQAQAPMPQFPAQANAYTITPEEYATMQSRMRQSGQPGGQQFGENVQAQRATPPQGDVVQAI